MTELKNIPTRELLKELLTRTDRAEGLEVALFSTDALTHELLSRFDHAGFIGMRVQVTPETHQFMRKWKGNTHQVVGLLADLQFTLIDASKENETVVEEDPK